MRPWQRNQGFTLIELSIVLVIIGLIVGGILVGQDMISAAAVRAQLAQIEEYNSAVNAFYGKYGYLPGDMPASDATPFGFIAGTSCTGGQAHRDGNGLLDGGSAVSDLYDQSTNEVAFFWIDISSAVAGNLIDGQFPNSQAVIPTCGLNINLTTTPGTTYVGDYLPAAKIGRGNFVYVYETGGHNWFGLSAISTITSGVLLSAAEIPVTQAYNIDKKIDDGLPTTGIVETEYLNNSLSTVQAAPNGNPDTGSTCYNSSTLTYSTNVSNGSGPNCALSFKMQGAGR